MYTNPPYKFICRSCKPPVYMKEYGHLRAHYRAIHDMRDMPPIDPSWYEAPLGVLSRPPSGNYRPREFVRTFHGVNPHRRVGLSIPDAGETENAEQASTSRPPIDREELRKVIDEAVQKHLTDAIQQRLPSLANEIDTKVSSAIRDKVPNMINDHLLDIVTRNLDESTSSSVHTPMSGRSRIINMRSIENSPQSPAPSRDSTTPHTQATKILAEADILLAKINATPVAMSQSDEDLMSINIEPVKKSITEGEILASTTTINTVMSNAAPTDSSLPSNSNIPNLTSPDAEDKAADTISIKNITVTSNNSPG